MTEFNFSENMSVVTLDSVPEQYRGVYAEQEDGTYAVADNAKGIVEAYVGQTTALNKTRADLTASNNESAERRVLLKEYKDVLTSIGVTVNEGDDPLELLKNHVNELTTKAQNGQEIQVNLDKIQKDADQRVLEAEQKGNEKIAFMQSSLEKHMIGEAAVAALAKHEGSVDLLMPHVKGHCKLFQDQDSFVVRVVDGEGDSRSNGAGGWMTVEDLVAEMKTKEQFAPAFKSEVQSGSGTKPGSTSRPVSKPTEELSATDKIAAGLNKGQYQRH